MKQAFFALLLLFAAPAFGGPLETAQQAFDAGHLDDVDAALTGVKFEAAPDTASAATLLARSAQKARDAGDDLLALLLAQRALKFVPDHAVALETAAQICRKQQEFDGAEKYADALVKAWPKLAGPKLLRSEISIEQGEWQRALDGVKGIDLKAMSPEERARFDTIVTSARKELELYSEGLTVLKSLEDRQKAAMPGAAPDFQPSGATGGGSVTVYSASWCGVCKRAMKWLDSKGVPYRETDIEKDSRSAAELVAKAKKAGVRLRGVPVIDVDGELTVGFAPGDLEALLRRHKLLQ